MEVKMISAYSEVRNYNNEQLRSLLKEIKEIGKLDAPKYAKQTAEMKHLFNTEKTNYNNWYNQFSYVSNAIEVEILHRIRTNKM